MSPDEGGTKLSPAIEDDNRIVDSVEFMELQYNKRNEGGLEPLYNERGKRSDPLFTISSRKSSPLITPKPHLIVISVIFSLNLTLKLTHFCYHSYP